MASPEFIAVYAPENLPDTDIIKQCAVCGKDVAIHLPGQAILAVNPGLVIFCHRCAEYAFAHPPAPPEPLPDDVVV